MEAGIEETEAKELLLYLTDNVKAFICKGGKDDESNALGRLI